MLLSQTAKGQDTTPDEPFGLGFTFKLWAPDYPCGVSHGANLYINTTHVLISADIDGCGTNRYSFIDRQDVATVNLGIAPWGTAQQTGLAPVFFFGYGGRKVADRLDDGSRLEIRQRVVRTGVMLRQRGGKRQKGRVEGAFAFTLLQVTIPVATETAVENEVPRVFGLPVVTIFQVQLSVGPGF